MSGVNKPNNITIKRKSPNGSTYTYTLTNNRSGISKIRVNNNKTHKFSEVVVESITNGNTNNTLLDENNERTLISKKLEKMRGLNKKSNAYKNEHSNFITFLTITDEYTQMRRTLDALMNMLYEIYTKESVTPEITKLQKYKDFRTYYAYAALNNNIADYNKTYNIVLYGNINYNSKNSKYIKISYDKIKKITKLSYDYFNAINKVNDLLPEDYQIKHTTNTINYTLPNNEYEKDITRIIYMWVVARNNLVWWYEAFKKAEAPDTSPYASRRSSRYSISTEDLEEEDLEEELAKLEANGSTGGTRRRKRQKKYKLRTAKRKIRRI
jgi:hypothetical protein